MADTGEPSEVPAELRTQFELRRDSAIAEAEECRMSMLVPQRLATYYKALGRGDQLLAVPIVCEWLLSDDESRRWDAEFLVSEFSIREAVPTLRSLAERLEGETTPDAPYEWAKVNRLLAGLSGEEVAT